MRHFIECALLNGVASYRIIDAIPISIASARRTSSLRITPRRKVSIDATQPSAQAMIFRRCHIWKRLRFGGHYIAQLLRGHWLLLPHRYTSRSFVPRCYSSCFHRMPLPRRSARAFRCRSPGGAFRLQRCALAEFARFRSSIRIRATSSTNFVFPNTDIDEFPPTGKHREQVGHASESGGIHSFATWGR